MSDPRKPGRGGFRIIDGGVGNAEPRADAPNGGPKELTLAPGLDLPRPPAAGETWTDRDADAWLRARDLVGCRFALDRITSLLEALGGPQNAAPAIHVVGTNGKSSVTRMTAALLRAHGRRTGAYLSPHLVDLRERIEIDGAPIPESRHAAAVARVARAATMVDRPGDLVTQFEAHTASAYVAIETAGCDVMVIEAGLGGRLDATATVNASVVALTNVDLEHTALLGDTIAEIAAEKVAVAGPGSTLVLGPELSDEAMIVARDHAARIGATVVTARPVAVDKTVTGGYQQANFATARTAATAFLGALEPRVVRTVAREFAMPARFERIASAPQTILDGAHNPAGARALAGSLRAAGLRDHGVAVMSVLADKDAGGIIRALAGTCDRFVLCDCGSDRAVAPDQLAEIVRVVAPDAEARVVDDPVDALKVARSSAGRDGFVVVCGTLGLARAVRPTEGGA